VRLGTKKKLYNSKRFAAKAGSACLEPHHSGKKESS
jgi:hypothetical protein